MFGYKFDPHFTDTDNRINLITSKMTTVDTIIDYCLHAGISKKSPPSYFFTRIYDDVGMLFNTLSDNSKVANQANILNISTNSNEAGNDMTIYIDNVELYSGIDGLRTLNALSSKSFYDFDHINRKWIQTNYTSRDMIGFSFKKSNVHQHGLFNPPQIFDTLNKNQGFTNFNHPFVLYDIMTDLEKNIKIFRFNTYGKLVRDCGQIVLMNSRK